MFQVRIHGRGGQGVVTAAELLSVAAFVSGHEAQAFPSFGSERMGAPVMAFCRIDERPIRSHEPITVPDALIIQDPTLLHQVDDLFTGAGPDTYVLLNTTRPLHDLGEPGGPGPERTATLPATEIAQRVIGRPVPNTTLLGGFSALTGVVPLDALAEAIRRRFKGPAGEANVVAANEAATYIHEQQGAPSRA